MKRFRNTATLFRRLSVALAVTVVSLQASSVHAQPLNSSFTVQGALSDAGVPETGPVDLRFRLFDALVGGNQIGVLITRTNVMLDDGIFSVMVDFGADAFQGQQRWIEIQVRDTGSGSAYTTLTPRRPALPTPYALFANKAAAAQDLFNVMGNNATINFGPTGECLIGINPDFPGLTEVDPIGFRLLGQNLEGCRLFFGPTDDCRIEINPNGPPGLTLLDPNCIRVLNPLPTLPTKVLFGPTNDCAVGIRPDLPGLLLQDPNCVRILPTIPGVPPILKWGPTDDCAIGIVPNLPGLSEMDPFGFRLLGRDLQGCRLLFGPTDDCTIEIDPNGPRGLLLRDPNFIRVLNPVQGLPNVLAFGESDECVIQVMPKDISSAGMIFTDPRGFGFEAGFVGIGLGDQRPGFPLQVNGPVAATEFIQFSSSEFKTEVRPLDNALELIEALEGVNFKWKEMNDGRADVGFIAEEVEKVLPQLVRTQDGKAAGIAYHRLTAVTVEAIKAQQRQIAALNQERDELTDRVAQLEAGLARILDQLEKGEN